MRPHFWHAFRGAERRAAPTTEASDTDEYEEEDDADGSFGERPKKKKLKVWPALFVDRMLSTCLAHVSRVCHHGVYAVRSRHQG